MSQSMLRRRFVCLIALGATLSTVPDALAQSSAPATPVLYVETADEDFNIFIAAAMTKKKVPIVLTTDSEKADLRLKASSVAVEKQSTGSKWARCLFASCAGIEDRSNVSVHVIDREGAIVWSYSVNKGRGQKNKQSMAEAIAKHFKSEYLHR